MKLVFLDRYDPRHTQRQTNIVFPHMGLIQISQNAKLFCRGLDKG